MTSNRNRRTSCQHLSSTARRELEKRFGWLGHTVLPPPAPLAQALSLPGGLSIGHHGEDMPPEAKKRATVAIASIKLGGNPTPGTVSEVRAHEVVARSY